MKLGIVILNFNGLEDTLECIKSIKKLNNTTILVVDNASTDKSKEVLEKISGVRLIINKINLGFSGGNNVGIRYCLENKFDLMLVLNNDTLLADSTIEELLRGTKAADIISPKIYFAKNYEFHKDRYKEKDLGKVIWYAGGNIDWQNVIGGHIGVDEVDNGQFDQAREIDFATGAAMLVKREVFEKIGLFDERYFLYLEDMDFCVRAKKAGFKIMYEPKAIVWHKNAQSLGGSGSKLQDYYITRNRLLFAFKFAKLKTKMAVFKQTLFLWQNSVKRRALLDFLLYRFGKSSVSQ